MSQNTNDLMTKMDGANGVSSVSTQNATSTTVSTTKTLLTTNTQANISSSGLTIDPEISQLKIGRIATEQEIQNFNACNIILQNIATEYKSEINMILATLQGKGGDSSDSSESSGGGNILSSAQDELLGLIESFMKNVTSCEQASATNSNRLATILANKNTITNNQELMNTYKNQLTNTYNQVKKQEHTQTQTLTMNKN